MNTQSTIGGIMTLLSLILLIRNSYKLRKELKKPPHHWPLLSLKRQENQGKLITSLILLIGILAIGIELLI